MPPLRRVASGLLGFLLRVLNMNFGEAPFRDREDAGRRLAERLARYRDEDPVVLALPRGGVPVGYKVARALKAPLDVFIARKLGAPNQPELGIGAVAQDGTLVLNERIVEEIGVSEEYIERIAAEEMEEARRHIKLFRVDRPEPEVRERTAILVDDGIATGVTTWAAIEALRRQGPRRLVLAVPVCAAQTAESLRREVDELICLVAPSDLMAIGLWYRHFEQTSDEEVVELLERARREQEEECDANDPDRRT
jgi:putative phosphoribosyl transferase